MAMLGAKCSAPGGVASPLALSGWTVKGAVTSATQAPGLDAAMLVTGKAAAVTLHPTRDVQYVIQPEKPGGSVAHGGLLAVTIAEAGTYQVSLGGKPDDAAQGWHRGGVVGACTGARLHRHPQDGAVPPAAGPLCDPDFTPILSPPSMSWIPESVP